MLSEKEYTEINDRSRRIGLLAEIMEDNLEIVNDNTHIADRLYTIRYYVSEEATAITKLTDRIV